jgi:hypothetical protein
MHFNELPGRILGAKSVELLDDIRIHSLLTELQSSSSAAALNKRRRF